MNFSVRSPIQYVHFRIVPVLKPYLLCTIFPPRRRFGRHRSHNIWFIDHHLHLPAKISTQPTVWAFLKIYSHAQLGQPTGFFSMSTAVFIWPQIVIYLSKTSQELRMLSSVTLNCQATKIVMNLGSQWSEL